MALRFLSAGVGAYGRQAVHRAGPKEVGIGKRTGDGWKTARLVKNILLKRAPV